MAEWIVFVEDARTTLNEQEYQNLNVAIDTRIASINEGKRYEEAYINDASRYDYSYEGCDYLFIVHGSDTLMDETFDLLAAQFPALHLETRCDNGVPMQVQAGNRSAWQQDSILRSQN